MEDTHPTEPRPSTYQWGLLPTTCEVCGASGTAFQARRPQAPLQPLRTYPRSAARTVTVSISTIDQRGNGTGSLGIRRPGSSSSPWRTCLGIWRSGPSAGHRPVSIIGTESYARHLSV